MIYYNNFNIKDNIFEKSKREYRFCVFWIKIINILITTSILIFLYHVLKNFLEDYKTNINNKTEVTPNIIKKVTVQINDGFDSKIEANIKKASFANNDIFLEDIEIVGDNELVIISKNGIIDTVNNEIILNERPITFIYKDN